MMFDRFYKQKKPDDNQVAPTLFWSCISSETKFTARFLILWYFLAAIILRWDLYKFKGALDFGMRRQTNILSTSFVFSPVFITFKMRYQTIGVHFLLSVYPLFGIGAKPQIMLKSTSYYPNNICAKLCAVLNSELIWEGW